MVNDLIGSTGTLFLNGSDVIGQILNGGAYNVAGNIFIAMTIFLIILFIIGMMFNIPFEFMMILLIPFIVAGAASGNPFFVGILVVIALFFSFLAPQILPFR